MKYASLLIALSAASLFACGKSEDVPAPAVEAVQAEPAAAAPAAEPTPAAQPEPTPAAQPEATPAAPAAASKPAAEPAKAPPAKPAAVALPPSAAAPNAVQPDLARGQQIYRQACAFCHDKGVAGAPKTGDTAAWGPRLAQGMDALVASSLRGKGAMPAKGGNPSLADADVRAAVDYLVAQSR